MPFKRGEQENSVSVPEREAPPSAGSGAEGPALGSPGSGPADKAGTDGPRYRPRAYAVGKTRVNVGGTAEGIPFVPVWMGTEGFFVAFL